MHKDRGHSSLNILLDNIEGTNLLLEYYSEVSRKIFTARDFRNVILILHQEIRKIYAKQHVEFIIWQHNKNLLKFTYNPEAGQVNSPEEIVQSNTLYHYTLLQKQTILTNNYQLFCENLGMDPGSLPASSWLGIPMLVRGKVLGMVVIWDGSPEHYFRLQDKQFMSIITNITAFAVENIYLYEYISEKSGSTQPIVAAPIEMKKVDTATNLVEQLLNMLVQGREIRYAGIFLRSQTLEKWDCRGKVSTKDHPVDLSDLILKNLIYIQPEFFQQSEPLFWQKTDRSNLLMQVFNDALKDQPVESILLMPYRIQHYYIGVLFLAFEKRRDMPDPAELAALTFPFYLLVQLMEKEILLEHKQSYDAYIQHLEKMKIVGELASGSAHHLNNILSVISGRAQILHKKLNGSPLQQEVGMIEQAAEDGALAVRRLQSVKSRRHSLTRFELLNVNQLILEVVEIARPRFEREAQSCGITYDVKLTLGSDSFVRGDAPALREVFLNLIGNALDAMPRGGKLTVQTTAEKNNVYIFLSDTGGGIPEELKEKIFQPFFSTKGEKGNGLGLSIAADIIASHQGKIYVDSLPSKGSIFMIELPEVREKPAGTVTDPKIPAGLHYQVLLVDDENPVGETLAEMLREEGCQVTLINNPSEALHKFLQIPCDIVLTDLSMPGLNGLELARQLKATGREIPVVLITGWNSQDREMVKANGSIDGYIEKPFNLKQIREVFRLLLQDNGRSPGRPNAKS